MCTVSVYTTGLEKRGRIDRMFKVRFNSVRNVVRGRKNPGGQKRKKIVVYVDAHIKDQIERMAVYNGQTVSAFCGRVLSHHTRDRLAFLESEYLYYAHLASVFASAKAGEQLERREEENF